MEEFINSEFFPPSDTTSGLVECQETKLPIFAKDTNNRGAKKFFCSGYERFVSIYESMIAKKVPPNVYEVLVFDKPSKLYFDFDAPDMQLEPFTDLVLAFIKHCVIQLNKIFSTDSFHSDNVMILNSSNDQKRSSHVIFQYFFKSIQNIKLLIEQLVMTFPIESIKEILDLKVYTRHRCFRLLYSSKFEKPTILTYGNDLSFNEYNLFDSLIQGRLIPHYTGKYSLSKYAKLHKQVFEFKHAQNNNQIRDSTTSVIISKDELPGRLEEYLRNNGGVVRSCKKVDCFIHCIIGNMKCPWIKKCHKSNNQFFTFNIQSNIGWFKCSDGDCITDNYNKTSLKFLLKDY